MGSTEKHLPISPELVQLWEHQAERDEAFAGEWRIYAMMMAAFQAAIERAPRTTAACERVDIERLLISEVEHVADVVNAIFPRGGIMEFASYLTSAKKREQQKSDE